MAAGFRFAPEVEGVAVVIAGVGTGEARIGVNGVNVSEEAKLPRALRVASTSFWVCESVRWGVGWSESNCNREPERLSRRVGGAGTE